MRYAVARSAYQYMLTTGSFEQHITTHQRSLNRILPLPPFHNSFLFDRGLVQLALSKIHYW